MDKIGFFTPVKSSDSVKSLKLFLLEKTDSYFYLGGKRAEIISTPSKGQAIEVKLVNSRCSLLAVALKVASYCTLLMPALALTAKVFLRSNYDFYVFHGEKLPSANLNSLKTSIKNENQEDKFRLKSPSIAKRTVAAAKSKHIPADSQGSTLSTLFQSTLGAKLSNESELEWHERSYSLILKACEDENWGLLSQFQSKVSACVKAADQSIVMHFLLTENDEMIKKIVANNLYRTLVGKDSDHVIHAVVRKGLRNLAPLFFRRSGTCLARLSALDSRGANLLLSAIEGGQNAFIPICLRYGNHPSQYLMYNNFRLNALSFAIYKGFIECLDQFVEAVQELRQTSKINFSQNIEQIGNILHLAIWMNQPEMLRHLLTKYRKKALPLIEGEDYEGKTPLMLAASLGDLQSLKILLDAKALIEAKDSMGRTAMHYAAQNNHKHAIRFLSKEGADESARDDQNKAPSDLGDEATRDLLFSLKSNRQIDERMSIDCMIQDPHNCIFYGGGAQGLVFFGVVKALEELQLLGGMKRFAGTGAGALAALFLALGMNASQLEYTLKETVVKELLDLLAVELSEEKKQSFNEYLETVQKAASITGKVGISLLKTLTASMGLRLGWTNGEKLKNWLNELIREHTGIPNCTFGELAAQIKEGSRSKITSKKFKHLHMIITDLKTFSLLHINSESKKWKNFLIADAVVASSAYPVFMAPQKMREKINGELVANQSYQCSEGGILLTLPAEIFDRKEEEGGGDPQSALPQFNRRSIAFCFEPTKLARFEDESPDAFLGSILAKIYMNSEPINRQIPSGRHEERLVSVMDGGTQTTELNIKSPKEEGDKAIDNAYLVVKKYFEERKREAEIFFKDCPNKN
ncbi:ankyrin repeat domain-containing protein [Parachlamydia sp. AcF125]|uniref:ankyrin repeat domain-containing protein n=1 Tax=Parachlamydia sp. AcF125 TaxID=2795736 RepID=UPI001BC97D84|nr:ankyrin repeat domain-containing protein [Parachlamydia sp. AcF125]MBS4168157.1 hypothetical protein [Parachlamydia sp. AcF125]